MRRESQFWQQGSGMSFPKDFVWGAAAASYQIEGASAEDGKGPSVWDAFCRVEGAVREGHTGDVACDHYHRYRDDVALMKSIGLRAYRLSISWPRVIPDGAGAVNEKGLAFYDRLIDELLRAGIAPWVTLFHWDYPHALYARGGWLNPDSPQWFADYTQVIAKKLSDRVQHWMTLNEPQCFIGLGHQAGIHAPGLKLGWADVLRAAHHSLLAHGRAVQTLRAACKAKPTIGWAPVGITKYPPTDSREDIEAARRATWSASSERSLWNNSLFSDPVCLGKYPDDALKFWGDKMPRFDADDLRTMHQPLDFFGVNIYHGDPVRAGPDGNPQPVPRPPGYGMTAMHWAVEPRALYWGPKFFAERYKLPIVITENGMANCDWVALDGKVHDPQRVDFTRRYLRELKRAISDGIDVRGYFHWSVMDNFEWAEGYRQRFGLVHVDYATQQRTPKDSAAWYGEVIRTNGEMV
jgi:beta-glucosidase